MGAVIINFTTHKIYPLEIATNLILDEFQFFCFGGDFLQGALGILAIPPALLIGLGFIIHEVRTDALHSEKKQKVSNNSNSRNAFLMVISLFFLRATD